MALQYGIFAANYPLTEEDLEANTLPPRLEPHRRKLYALTIEAERLQRIRNEQAGEPLRLAPAGAVRAHGQALFNRYSRPVARHQEAVFHIEEIASRILNNTGIEQKAAALSGAHRDPCARAIATVRRLHAGKSPLTGAAQP